MLVTIVCQKLQIDSFSISKACIQRGHCMVIGAQINKTYIQEEEMLLYSMFEQRNAGDNLMSIVTNSLSVLPILC